MGGVEGARVSVLSIDPLGEQMRSKSFRAAMVAALLAVVAMCAVPAFASAASRTDRSQNVRIARHSKSIKKIAAVLTLLSGKGLDGRLKVIEDAAPQIIDGLSKLKDGLTQLKDGLTQAGDGLTKLKTLATSQEYGFGQVLVISAGPTVNAEGGSFIQTPDIPDAVQQAQTSQQFIAQHTGTVSVAYGVRSGESDGTGAANPAAFCRVWVMNEADDLGQTAANAALGGVPFQPVNTKSPMTSTDPANAGFPFGLKQSGADADVTTTLNTTVAVAAGDTVRVGMSCVDTSPDANDPSA
jgi:X-X-X-Leu-X-X-Gly heptad repeat protein